MNEFHNSNTAGNDLNEQGLRLFNSAKYDEAINSFNKAIVKNASVPAYFTNRAQCYMKLKHWESACQDCRNAIGLNAQHADGYHFLGLALLELQRYDEAIKNILRGHFAANELEQHLSFNQKDICSQVQTAINGKRAAQGKQPITIEGFSTKFRSSSTNGKREETRVVRLRFRKKKCHSLLTCCSKADETIYV